MARGQFLLWRERNGGPLRPRSVYEETEAYQEGPPSTDRELRPERPRLLPHSPQQYVGGSFLT